MSLTAAAARIAVIVLLFSFLITSVAWNNATYAAVFGVLFGTALERLILTAPRF